MSKLTTSAAVAVLTASLTAVVWNSVSSAPGATELAGLRAENARLVAASAPDASPATVAAAADEFDRRAAELARVMQERSIRARAARDPSEPGGNTATGGVDGVATSSGHRNRGQSTPADAQLTFAWAADVAELDVLANLLWFDGDARAAAAEVLAGLPPSVRTQYATPEALYAMFLSAETQLGPPPGPEWFATLEPVEVGPGRVKFRRPGATQPDFWAYQQTDDGWKVVIPLEIVPIIARNVLSSDFFAQLSPAKP